MSEEAVETSETSPTPKSVHLTSRLLAPTTILSVVLLALTLLPMSKCSNDPNDSDGEIVPAVIAVAMLGRDEQPPLSWFESIERFVSQVPLLFLITWPYWNAFPGIAAGIVVIRWPRAATTIYRLLLLLLAGAVTSLAFAVEPLWRPVVGVGGLVALATIVVSFPFVHRSIFRWTSSQRFEGQPNRVHAAFTSVAILCATASIMLATLDQTILYGGILALFTNLSMVFVAVTSAAQSKVDCKRTPRFKIAHVLCLTFAIAVILGWLFRNS